MEVDEIGNMTKFNGYDFNWNGRRLESISQNGVELISYEYNIDGQRTKKTAPDLKTGEFVTTEYFYNGDILAGQKRGNDVLIFMYDNNSNVFGFEYNGTPYYYVKNAQNDVYMIVDETGVAQVLYMYDAWGRIGCYDATNFGLATINPLMYRSYYLDVETGYHFYYLNSRYYLADLGRFVSADSVVSGVGQDQLGYNIFAYCQNNPVNFYDPSGMTCICLTQRVHPRHKCSSSTGNATGVVEAIDPDVPPDHPDYTPPKKNGDKKVKNPNGPGRGWPAKDGGVWMPTPNMHGGEGWTVQYPGGGHSHAYPGGKVRNHFQVEQSAGQSIIMIFTGAILTVGLIADDFTGFGIADNFLTAASTACFACGVNGLLGKEFCAECGEYRYGY